MTIQIEKNIPIPRKGTGDKSPYPLDEMEVGDSVFIKGKTSSEVSGIMTWHRRAGKQFTCRTLDGGVRIWRTA